MADCWRQEYYSCIRVIIIAMNDNPLRLVNPLPQPEDRMNQTLRPRLLNDLIGQDKVKENLQILILAAKKREEPLDHVLFYGPPGLGKTTMAHVLANEMAVNIKVTSGPAIERPGDLAAILTNLRAGDILFIDEVHRLGKAIEEVLYPAMEDYALDIIIGKGPSAAFHPAQAAAFHSNRCNDPPGVNDRTIANSLWCNLPPGFLFPGGDPGDREACSWRAAHHC